MQSFVLQLRGKNVDVKKKISLKASKRKWSVHDLDFIENNKTFVLFVQISQSCVHHILNIYLFFYLNQNVLKKIK